MFAITCRTTDSVIRLWCRKKLGQSVYWPAHLQPIERSCVEFTILRRRLWRSRGQTHSLQSHNNTVSSFSSYPANSNSSHILDQLFPDARRAHCAFQCLMNNALNWGDGNGRASAELVPTLRPAHVRTTHSNGKWRTLITALATAQYLYVVLSKHWRTLSWAIILYVDRSTSVVTRGNRRRNIHKDDWCHALSVYGSRFQII